MTATKTFDVRTILTVTTGRLLTEPEGERDNGIGRLYKLLEWMTGEAPFTHSLGRFGDECKPWLLRWFPELAKADAMLPKLDELLAVAKSGGRDAIEDACESWITMVLAAGVKSKYAIENIPADDHERKDPVEELIAMVGPGKVIGVVASTE